VQPQPQSKAVASPILGSAGATISYRFLKTPQAVVTLDDSVSGTSQKRRDCMSHVSGLWRVLGERIIVAFGASKTRAMVCNRAPEISRFPDAQLRIGGWSGACHRAALAADPLGPSGNDEASLSIGAIFSIT